MSASLSQIQSLISFAGQFFLHSALILWIVRAWSPSSARTSRASLQLFRAALLGGILVALAVPVNGLSAAGYLRGLMGDLSITSVLLLGGYVARELTGRDWVPWMSWVSLGARKTLLYGIAIAATILYPLALGLTMFDPYQLGFQPVALLAVLFGLVLVLWRREPAAAVLVLLGLIAYNLQLLESTNLWDYLLDAWVALFAWGWIVKRQINRWSSARREKRFTSARNASPEASQEPPPVQSTTKAS